MIKDDKDLLNELSSARIDEAYHRKKMEYNQEIIKILRGKLLRT